MSVPARTLTAMSSLTATGVEPQVEIRRSTRRRRTVSAYRDGERIVVLVPARLDPQEEQRLVQDMVRRVERSQARRRPGDMELASSAQRLSEQYLGGLARPVTVRWVDNQRTRWGSCTPSAGSIRLSSRMTGMPAYVVDYVLLHELAHLIRPDHSRAFWQLLEGYPHLERARSYLEGAAFGAGLPAGVADDDMESGGDAAADEVVGVG